jgi:Tol biopolymer transport system component
MNLMLRFLVLIALAGVVFTARVPASSATFAGRNGSIAYAVGGGEQNYSLRAIRSDGTHDRRLIGHTPYGGGMFRGPSGPQWSSDGKRLLFGAHSHLDNAAFGLKYATASGKRIRKIPLHLKAPVVLYGWAWAPDGRHVVFASGDFKGHSRIYTIALDGSHRKRLTRGEMPTWSSDGRYIVFQRGNASVGKDLDRYGLFIMRSNGHGLRRLTPSNEDGAPSISPDGRRVLYVRTVGGPTGHYQREEWRIVDVNGQSDTLVTTHVFGVSRFRYGHPQWTPDGQRLAAVRDALVNDRPLDELVTISPTGADPRVEFRFPFEPSLLFGFYEDSFAWQPR